MANAVLHAYPGGRGVIDVRARREAGGVAVEIDDRGVWHEARRGRGHGLALMRQLVDECEIQTGPAGTIVRLLVAAPVREAGAVRP